MSIQQTMNRSFVTLDLKNRLGRPPVEFELKAEVLRVFADAAEKSSDPRMKEQSEIISTLIDLNQRLGMEIRSASGSTDIEIYYHGEHMLTLNKSDATMFSDALTHGILGSP